MQHIDLIKIWRQLLEGFAKPWVLFENGTCVVVDELTPDVVLQAQEALREWGPVGPGSEAGDFRVLGLKGHLGWIVTGHHHAIGTFVGTDEVAAGAHDVEVGLRGRSKRGMDAAGLRVIHVEATRQDVRLVASPRCPWTPWQALTKWRASRAAQRIARDP